MAALALVTAGACDSSTTSAAAGAPAMDATAGGGDAALPDVPGPDPTPAGLDEPSGELDRSRLLVAVDSIAFVRESAPGVVDGFDLDGVVSVGDDAGSCFVSDYTGPDGTAGVDSNFATFVPLLANTQLGAIETLIQNSIDEGGLLLLWQLEGVDDLVDDDNVTLRFRLGKGEPLLGTDGFLLSGQTFHLHDESPDLSAPNATITDGVLVAGPFDTILPIVVFNEHYSLSIHGAYLRATLTFDGNMVDGIMSGGVPIADIETIAVKADSMSKDVLEDLAPILAAIGDLAPDEDGDCQEMSAGLTFSGVSADLHEDVVTTPCSRRRPHVWSRRWTGSHRAPSTPRVRRPAQRASCWGSWRSGSSQSWPSGPRAGSLRAWTLGPSPRWSAA